MCLNWKALLVLIAVGGGLFFFLSPARASVVAPFLLFTLCPLSMIFAMRGMNKGHNEHKDCAVCEQDQSSNQHTEKHNHGTI